jgi:sulfite exporter TauE/SafE
MTPLDISIPFGLGVVSSLHCSQMWGPIVLA